MLTLGFEPTTFCQKMLTLEQCVLEVIHFENWLGTYQSLQSHPFAPLFPIDTKESFCMAIISREAFSASEAEWTFKSFWGLEPPRPFGWKPFGV